MRIGNIDIPQEILDAQQQGKLVIFAGAGISKPAPSNLPNFGELVQEIARGTSYEPKKDEPFDYFLGNLVQNGVKVHEIAKRILSENNPEPNQLHHAIVKLFKNPEDLRIITTNQDNLFTKVIKAYNLDIEIYKAPALPVGSNFQGLVYLHGCIDSPADRLVFTDSDFGKAYITEGWARRFLLGVYANFTVLFIGYSHKDLILKYLARALPPDNKKLYALCPEEEVEHWEFLGIKPIPYSKENNHRILVDCITKWAKMTSWSTIDHEIRIQQLLSSEPPLPATEEDDYLINVVKDEIKVQFFVRYAKGTKWLFWADERRLLSPLFSFSNNVLEDKKFALLAEWFAREYALKHPNEVLVILERNGQRINRKLWYVIAEHLAYAEELNPEVLSIWLPLLIQYNPEGREVDFLGYLLENCAKSGDWKLVLFLFDFLTTPRIKLEKFLYSKKEGKPILIDACLLGDHYWLNKVWEEYLKKNLNKVAKHLIQISSHQIKTAFNLFHFYKIADHDWDPWSYNRPAIETHEQNKHLPRDYYLLIDICRDCLEWLLRNDYEYGRFLIEDWIKSPVSLLRRLAIHGITEDTNIKPDEKFQWILCNDLVRPTSVHHEFYRLLQKVYPNLNDKLRNKLIDYIYESIEAEISNNPNINPNKFRYKLFNLLIWLDNSVEGSCPLVRKRLKEIKEKHPDWKVREYPDFTHWSTGVKVGLESPISANELRKKSLSEVIHLLLTYKENNFWGPSREGLLNELGVAIAQDPDWGLDLMEKLCSVDEDISHVWKQLLWMFSEANLSEKQWKKLLFLIESTENIFNCDLPLAHLLVKGVRKKTYAIPYSVLPLAERIASKLWEKSVQKEDKPATQANDWLGVALNHTGGLLAEFFLIVLSLRLKQKGISPKIPDQLEKIVQDESYTGSMGRIVLASQVHFLFSVNPEWTVKNIVPLFDWKQNKLQATQAWHVFLTWGKWSDNLLERLGEFYIQCFDKLNNELKKVRKIFVERIASIFTFSSLDKTRNEWLIYFLENIDPKIRKDFAIAIHRILWSLDENRIKFIWKRWLSDYWENRSLGKPVPLDAQEFTEMVKWAPLLKPVFPEVVERIHETLHRNRLDLYKIHEIWHRLIENEIPQTFPRETLQFLSYILTNSQDISFYKLDELIDELCQYKKLGSDFKGDFKEVLNKLAEKGFPVSKYLEKLNSDCDSPTDS